MRKIITTLSFKVPEEGSIQVCGYDRQVLRSWLLFFDEILDVRNELFGIADDDADMQYLCDVGAVRQIVHRQSSSFGSDVIINSRSETFRRVEADTPGQVALGLLVDEWEGPFADDQRTLRVALHSALPVPNEDVPLAEILEFRDKRRDELQALHSYLDDVYQSVLSAPDRPLAQHAAIERLASQAMEQLRVVRERGFSFRLASLFSDFNLVPAGVAAAGTIALGGTLPLVVGNSIIAGASISVATLAGVLSPKTTKGPFRYVASYHEEVFRPGST